MSDYKRLDDSGLSALVTGYFTKIKDKLEDLGGLSNDAVATVEEETASKNYTAGDYFIKNDKLNIVIQNTTADTTWIKDENYEETSISEELNSINQKIDEIPQPSGTKQVTISQNGITTEDVEDYENAQITVNVPGPSGKITIQQNGTDIDVSSYALADVNVSQQGLTWGDVFSGDYNKDVIIDLSNMSSSNIASVSSGIFNPSTTSLPRKLDSLTVTGGKSKKISFNGSCFTNNVGMSYIRCEDVSVYLINSYAFQSVTVSGDVVFSDITDKIQTNAFSGFNSQSIKFETINDIQSYSFRYAKFSVFDCNSVTSRIGICAFSNCTNLTSFILRSTTNVSALNNVNCLESTPIESGTGYIYVPSALIDSYKAATNWTTYAAQFRALEDYTVDGTTTGDLDPTKI